MGELLLVASVGNVSNVMEEGRYIRFWFDDLLSVGSLCAVFPMLFRMPWNSNSSVKVCCVPMESRVSWVASFMRHASI